MISVDTKKKEQIGNFENKGREYCPKGEPVKVLDHDFVLPKLGKVNPYRVYDIVRNIGFVNLGNSYDIADFVVERIDRW